MRMVALMVAAGAVLAAGSAGAADKAGATDKGAQRGQAGLAKALAGRVAGKPVRCISLQQLDGPQIYEGTAIVYRVGRKTLYVNRTRDPRFLHTDSIPIVRVFGSQLCQLDSMRLLDRSTRIPRGFAVLGEFVPYTLPDRPKG
jgi:hypothetical protein